MRRLTAVAAERGERRLDQRQHPGTGHALEAAHFDVPESARHGVLPDAGAARGQHQPVRRRFALGGAEPEAQQRGVRLGAAHPELEIADHGRAEVELDGNGALRRLHAAWQSFSGIGLILGGQLADAMGRRRLIAICTPLSTACLVGAFLVGGPAMWAFSFVGGFTAAMAYPAFAVYRAELFPTGNRGTANGLVTATALLSGSVGILLVGQLRDRGASFGSLIAALSVGQLVAAMGTGLAGFKWLSNHWDAKLSNFIAQEAAAGPPNADLLDALVKNDPKRALEAVRQDSR